MMEKIIESNKEQDTYDLGYELGQHAKPGQVFTLVGDLGVGKTVFTKGLAAGLGITSFVEMNWLSWKIRWQSASKN